MTPQTTKNMLPIFHAFAEGKTIQKYNHRSAHVFNNIKMEQLLSVLKQERPNVNSGHNDGTQRRRDAEAINATKTRTRRSLE